MSTGSKLSKLRCGCDKFAKAEVERFADFAAEIPRRVGLLQDGQTLRLDGVEQWNIGAKAGAHARTETAHTNDGFSFRRVVQRDGWRNIR